MTARPVHQDRRLDRRIPLECPAFIHLRNGERIAAICTELGVGGMTLQTSYVPGEAEVLEVEVLTPGRDAARPPLVTKLAVRRCNALGGGRYELGGQIVRVVG